MRGGTTNPYTFRKTQRAHEIAQTNRLPFISLVESGGADLPTQAEIFIPGGRAFRNLTRLSAQGIPTVALVFGNSTAGGAYLPGMSDHVVMIEGRSKVFLAGPPLVKMATGEDADDESLGGAAMHARVSGSADRQDAEKAAQFIQLANQVDTPLLFLQNTTGYMVGTEYEQDGIIKAGSQMINAVSNSAVPQITLNIGASYGAGNYGMCGRAYDPRFLFTWPNAKSAVMGPAQLAGVLDIVGRASAQARGRDYDEEAAAAMRAAVEQQIERESLALFLSGRLYDDGIIDPRDTRTVLGLALSAIHNAPVRGLHDGWGVFRL